MNDAASEQIEKVGIPRKQMLLEITYSIYIYLYIIDCLRRFRRFIQVWLSRSNRNQQKLTNGDFWVIRTHC
jgi:hypothetical protein